MARRFRRDSVTKFHPAGLHHTVTKEIFISFQNLLKTFKFFCNLENPFQPIGIRENIWRDRVGVSKAHRTARPFSKPECETLRVCTPRHADTVRPLSNHRRNGPEWHKRNATKGTHQRNKREVLTVQEKKEDKEQAFQFGWIVDGKIPFVREFGGTHFDFWFMDYLLNESKFLLIVAINGRAY